jgi:hypothetical protein
MHDVSVGSISSRYSYDDDEQTAAFDTQVNLLFNPAVG